MKNWVGQKYVRILKRIESVAMKIAVWWVGDESLSMSCIPKPAHVNSLGLVSTNLSWLKTHGKLRSFCPSLCGINQNTGLGFQICADCNKGL